MTLDEQIQTALAASTDLAALIGTRFFHGAAPQAVVETGSPFAVWQEAASDPITAKDAGGFGSEAAFTLINFASWAAQPDSAKAIRDKIVAALKTAFISTARMSASGPVYQDPQTLRHNAPCIARFFTTT